MSARHPGRSRRAAALLPSDRTPTTPERPSPLNRDESSRGKLGAVRPCSPAEYTRAALLAADYATDEHPAGTPAADALGAELLDMLGLLDPDRRPAARALALTHRGRLDEALLEVITGA